MSSNTFNSLSAMEDNANGSIFDFETYYPNIAGIISVALLSFLGVLGNLILVNVVLLSRRLRTLPNVLILNLAIGDFFYIVCVGPSWIEHEYNPLFDLSTSACKLKQYITLVSQGACTFSLTVLSFERYSVIVPGMQTRQSRKKFRTCFAVFVVWCLSFVLAIPAAVLAYKRVDMLESACLITSTDLSDFLLALYRTVLFYIAPVGLISYFYLALFKSRANLLGQDSQTTNFSQQANRRRLAIICLVITVFFVLFWFPYYVFTIWSRVDSRLVTGKQWQENLVIEETFRVLQYFMSFINSATSPWLLFVLSTTHRRYLLKLLKRCGKRKSIDGRSTISNDISMSNTTLCRTGQISNEISMSNATLCRTGLINSSNWQQTQI